MDISTSPQRQLYIQNEWVFHQKSNINDAFLSALTGILASHQLNDDVATTLTTLARALPGIEGVELQSMLVGNEVNGKRKNAVTGYVGRSISRYLPRYAGTPAERRFVGVLIETSHPHQTGEAYASNETYLEKARKLGSMLSLRSLQRYLKSRLHQACFISQRRPGKRGNDTTRHTLTDAAKRFALFLHAVLAATVSAKALADLVRWALAVFLNIYPKGQEPDPAPGGEEQPQEPTDYVTPQGDFVTPAEPCQPGVSSDFVTRKEVKPLKEKQERKSTVTGFMGTVISLLKMSKRLEHDSHQLNRERAALRQKLDSIGKQRQQRDVNAISQPDDQIPPGFRGAGEAAPAPAPIAQASTLHEHERHAAEQADYIASRMSPYLVNRCRAAGVELK